MGHNKALRGQLLGLWLIFEEDTREPHSRWLLEQIALKKQDGAGNVGIAGIIFDRMNRNVGA